MSRGDDAYLADILAEARRIGRFLDGVTREEFIADELRRYAVMYALTIVGEAARRVTQDRRDALPQLPWRGMTDMRSVLVHDYGGVDPAIVWDAATKRVPDLIPLLETILEKRR